MQSCDVNQSVALAFAREQRDAKIHHQHLGNGRARISKVYTGTSDRELHEAMDRDAELLRAHGADNFHRTRIGRNASCPCGSGLKFKKCCISGAALVGPARSR